MPHIYDFPRRLLAGLCLLALTLTAAEARIGEDRMDLERRLESSRLARTYDKDMIANKVGDSPLARHFINLPDRVEHVIYYKSDTGEGMSSRDFEGVKYSAGWDLHVIYDSRGRSILEVYRRNDGSNRPANISEFEKNALLSLNKGNSFWQKADPRNLPEDVEALIPYEFVRDDGQAQALMMGGQMVFIAASLNAHLKAAQKEAAPVSVAGF